MKNGEAVIPPTVIDQIALWEAERNRFTFTDGVLYNQFLSLVSCIAMLPQPDRTDATLSAHFERLILLSLFPDFISTFSLINLNDLTLG